jgi:hypothetical protein
VQEVEKDDADDEEGVGEVVAELVLSLDKQIHE